jgi:catechol 2,3-dioxygenase-like lactoylglutathione lyase family enzyme
MSIEKLDHYSIRTTDLARAVRFYENALGFCVGLRPPFNFPGAWLYKTTPTGEAIGTSIVHLVGIDPQDGGGLTDYLGDKSATSDQGTGALDHIAFVATDIAGTYARLTRHAIAFRERKVPNMALHQLFIDDPDGVTIELNYAQPDDLATGQKNLMMHTRPAPQAT